MMNRKQTWKRLIELGIDEARLTGEEFDLYWANLRGANLCWANLRGANLRWANLRGANLRWANLTGVDLTGVDLRWAYLTGAILSGANLSGANLSKADLTGANLSGANLSKADLTGADLSGANLSKTCLNPTNEIDAEVARTALEAAGIHVNERGSFAAWRTAASKFCGSTRYKPSTYHAPYFSTDTKTECHPGLYFASEDWLREKYQDDKLVRIVSNIKHVIAAGGKFRCRRFRVVR